MARKEFKGELVRWLIDVLTKKGQRAIWDAYIERGFTNRLYNLHDSYGSAVYVDGVLDKSTIRYIGPEMTKEENWLSMGWVWTKGRSMPDFRGNRFDEGDEIFMNGREEVMDFFQHYKEAPKGTICLVVVAAMFYASILEHGEGHLKRKYAVISGARTKLEELSYMGKVERVYEDRDTSIPTTIKNKTWKQ